MNVKATSDFLNSPLRTLAQALADRRKRAEQLAMAEREIERRRKLYSVAIMNASPRSALD